MQPNVILTSSFHTVAHELRDKDLLPKEAIVAFVPTAGDPYEKRPWIDADRKALTELGCRIVDLDIKQRTSDELRRALGEADIVFVAGGNSTYLAECARRAGFADIVRDLLRAGKLYIGSSAGSILAGPSVEPFVEEDLPELAKDFHIDDPRCLGLVNYIILPHYPDLAEANDRASTAFSHKFRFVRLTDHEYRTEFVM